MKKHTPPKRLFKNPDRVVVYKEGASSIKRMMRASRDHLDILQNIEFMLVETHREHPEIDDRDVRDALRAALNGTGSESFQVTVLILALTAVRENRDDVSDDVWRKCLRVVEESVERHSTFRLGETSYLDFAAKYVK
jgi:hypothetical protein